MQVDLAQIKFLFKFEVLNHIPKWNQKNQKQFIKTKPEG
jgi:hypothetical protein